MIDSIDSTIHVNNDNINNHEEIDDELMTHNETFISTCTPNSSLTSQEILSPSSIST